MKHWSQTAIALVGSVLLLMTQIMVSAVAQTPDSQQLVMLGDINEDTLVNSTDALLAIKHNVKIITLDSTQVCLADITRDGVVNSSDAFLILKVAVHMVEPIMISVSDLERPIIPPTDPTEPLSPDLTIEGWQTVSGVSYYVKNGALLTGLQTIGGLRYQFNEQGQLISKTGIDVSGAQGIVDWKRVKAAGVDFVMLKIGYRGWGNAGDMREDSKFWRNVQGAADAGLDIGVYFVTQAITEEEAVAEANFVLERVKDLRLTYPIAFDIEPAAGVPEGETPRTKKWTPKLRTDVSIAFCNTIQKAGYQAAIYTSKSYFENQMQLERLEGYHLWLAHWTAQTSFDKEYTIWQYSDSGRVDGINGAVDLNISYVDYPSYLKEMQVTPE